MWPNWGERGNKLQHIMNELGDYIILILGWLFGILSPVLVSKIRDERESVEFKSAIMSELEEIKYRLILARWQIESKYGHPNHDFYNWAQSVLSNYKGINSGESLLKATAKLLKLSKNELDQYTEVSKALKSSNSGLTLKKHALSIINSNIGMLSKFEPLFRGQVLEIKTRLEFMNEMIDDARFFYKLSFQNQISTNNYEIADKNMKNTYKLYSERAKDIVDLIDKMN